MSSSKDRFLINVWLVFFIFMGGCSFAAEVILPETVKPGDLFVVRINQDVSKDKKISVQSEVGKVQFMGAVQGTPDIQMRNDSLLEIEPQEGVEQSYELKFLALGQQGSCNFKITDGNGERSMQISFVRENSSRNSSWIILAGGLALLVLGLKLWRYQKSSPAMMSTKSLFMNFEELEKARKMYFGDEKPASEAKVTAEKSSVVENPIESKDPGKKDENSAHQSAQKTAQAKAELNRADLGKPTINVSSDKTSQRPGLAPIPAHLAAEDQAKSHSGEIFIELTDESGKDWSAKGTSIKVGRRRDNQIILTASEISREHVCFFYKSGKIYVRSLTESNVTQLNGKDLKGEFVVNGNDSLNLGGSTYLIKKATCL